MQRPPGRGANRDASRRPAWEEWPSLVARRVEPWYSWISELIPGLVSSFLFFIFKLETAKGHP